MLKWKKKNEKMGFSLKAKQGLVNREDIKTKIWPLRDIPLIKAFSFLRKRESARVFEWGDL